MHGLGDIIIYIRESYTANTILSVYPVSVGAGLTAGIAIGRLPIEPGQRSTQRSGLLAGSNSLSC
jgi:hypothetical protein